MKKTKIICTIGPSSDSKLVLIDLLYAGMDVMRLNFSHGDNKEHQIKIDNLSKAIRDTGIKCSIMLDTKGPEIRTLKLKNHVSVKLKKRSLFTLTIDKNIIGNEKIVAISSPVLIKYLKRNQIILIDDGLIGLKILNVKKKTVECIILNNGILGENKSINIPGVNIPLPFLTTQDKKDIIFACKKKEVDFIAASFVRNTDDLLQIKELLYLNNRHDIQLIAKIENIQSLNNLDDIINYSDGIMIARGDLGVEIPLEELVITQKIIIKRCNQLGKSVITATQMLNSMISHPRPTRAEISDVTNAVLDGTDAVMLSAETASGYYPVESVEYMKKICEQTENFSVQKYLLNNNYCYHKKTNNLEEVIWLGSILISVHIFATIIVFTSDGESVKFLRKFCPNNIILAISKKIINELILIRGVINYHNFNFLSSYLLDDYITQGKNIAQRLGLVKHGDWLIILFDIKNLKIYEKDNYFSNIIWLDKIN